MGSVFHTAHLGNTVGWHQRHPKSILKWRHRPDTPYSIHGYHAFYRLLLLFAFKKWSTLSFILLNACLPRNTSALVNEGVGPDKNMLTPSANLSGKVGHLTNLAPPLWYLFLREARLFGLAGIFRTTRFAAPSNNENITPRKDQPCLLIFVTK